MAHCQTKGSKIFFRTPVKCNYLQCYRLPFMRHLLCAGSCARHSISFIFHPHLNLQGRLETWGQSRYAIAQENSSLPDAEAWHFLPEHAAILLRLPRTPGPPTPPCRQLGIAAGREGPCLIALWPKCPFPGQITCPWNSPFGTRHSNHAFSCLFLQKSSAIKTAQLPQRSILKSIAFSIHNWETSSIN